MVAAAAGRVIGVAVTQVGDAGHQRLEALYVDAVVRSHGVGRALAQAVLVDLDPASPVDLEVASFNQRAQRFYRRLGFRVVAGSQALWQDVLPVVTMRRPAGWCETMQDRCRGRRAGGRWPSSVGDAPLQSRTNVTYSFLHRG